jgi:biopolymer transport protein ExbB
MGFELFEKGGVVMVILAALSIYTIAIVLFKLYQFNSAGIFKTRFIEPALNAIRANELTKAREILGRATGPVARIMQAALNCVTDREMLQASREAEISRIGSTDIRYLESHMRGLEMVSNIAPLLGLLGTVIGMVTAFSRLESAGSRVDPSLLAGGIWEALLTTVGGLVVAIPAVAAYYIFDGIIERVRGTMKDTSIQIMMLEDSYQRTEREQRRRKAQARMRERAEKAEPDPAEVSNQKAQENERLRQSASDMRSTPQSSSTLKLLNPRYSQF